MYLGSWKIDDYLTIPLVTKNAGTGAATDDDGTPTYRVYEDDTGTPVESGSLAKLDDANTTGFYVVRIQLDTATGYEAGKSYTIYLESTVSSTVQNHAHSFQIQAEVALHADWIDGGRLDLLIDAIKGSTDDWIDGNRLDLIIDAINVVTQDWADGNRLDLILDAINTATSDWNDGERLDLILDAIDAKTTNLPTDPADQSLIIAATDAIITRLAGMEGTGFDTLLHSLVAIRNRGDLAWGASGSGSVQWAYTLTNISGGAPISDADVWVTTDLAGLNIVANARTDNFGVATFYLDPGTYYIWRQKSGWNFTNPDTEIVT